MNQVVVGAHMNQEKAKRTAQVFYNNRWVDKEHFRAFVYNETEQKLANDYKQYQDLIATGLWFDSKAKAIEAKQALIVEVIPEPVTVAEVEPEPEAAQVLELKPHKARKPKHGANS